MPMEGSPDIVKSYSFSYPFGLRVCKLESPAAVVLLCHDDSRLRQDLVFDHRVIIVPTRLPE